MGTWESRASESQCSNHSGCLCELSGLASTHILLGGGRVTIERVFVPAWGMARRIGSAHPATRGPCQERLHVSFGFPTTTALHPPPQLLLQVGNLALGGLSLPQLLRAETQLRRTSRHKFVIMIFLSGGPPRRTTGFTLIEFLVVIAFFAVLIGLLLTAERSHPSASSRLRKGRAFLSSPSRDRTVPEPQSAS